MPAGSNGPRLEVASGTRNGLVFPLTGELVTVGRGPDCQLRTDPDTELQVSARHAVLRNTGVGWAILDLGSRNGTTVNDVPVTAETPLREGDRIVLGGETILVYHSAPAAAGTRSAAGGRRAAVWLLAILALLLVGLAAFLYAGRAGQRSWEAERAQMRQRLDSLQHANEQAEAGLRGQVSGLAEALQASRAEVETLRADLARSSSRGDASGTTALRQRLQAATTALKRQQLAAGLDFVQIQRVNRPAVAMLYVEYHDGRVATATAFAVRSNGTLVTNRHALFEGDGKPRPRRVAVQFAESDQVWPARLLSASEAYDLALIKVDNIVGAVPHVRALNVRLDTIAPGSAVAMIGFPLGGEEPTQPRAGRAAVVRPVVTAGILREASAELLKVQGYGAAGASGSPIFDASGAVVGVLYGGREEGSTQMLYAVPAAAVERLLAGTEKAGGS